MSPVERKRVNQRMSQIVIHNGIVYLAGQVAQGARGASVTAQTRDILQSIDELLAEAGTNKSRVLTAQIWLSDISSFEEMNGEWNAWVAEGASPARACVEAKLAAPDFTVEIMISAAI